MPYGNYSCRLLAHSLLFKFLLTSVSMLRHLSADVSRALILLSSRLVTGTGSPLMQLPGSGREQ
jgi:hypothetical protein